MCTSKTKRLARKVLSSAALCGARGELACTKRGDAKTFTATQTLLIEI
jgi:hypothetical protein